MPTLGLELAKERQVFVPQNFRNRAIAEGIHPVKTVGVQV
jgi:hypothetical protein